MENLTPDQIAQAKAEIEKQIRGFEYEMEHKKDLTVNQAYKLVKMINAAKDEIDSLDQPTSKSGSIEL